MTWDELLDGLKTGAGGAEDANDLIQLGALVAAAEALDIRPFAAYDTWEEISARLPDLIALTDQATRPRPGITSGRGEPDSQFHWRRYAELAPTRTNVTLGVFRDWEHRSPVTPIWVRFHSGTQDFRKILGRAESLPGSEYTMDKGHLLMPLGLPRDVTGSAAAADVARQLAALCAALDLPTGSLPGGKLDPL